MQSDVGDRKRRRDSEHLPDADAVEHSDERDRRALIARQSEHQGRDRYSEPDLRLDQADAEGGEGQP
jgi:hypothetical protein